MTMAPRLKTILLMPLLTLSAWHATAQAQQEDLEGMQRSIEIFSGILREGLDLNSRAGIFSPLNGSLRGSYLMEQGIVLEISAPLANSRSAINWQTFESSLQQLSGQISSFVNTQVARVNPPDLEAARTASADFLETLRQTDFSADIEKALAEAGESARSLYQLGQIDDAKLNEITQEVNELRASLSQRMQELLALRTQATAVPGTDAAANENALQLMQEGLAQLMAKVQPLQERARSRAQELMALADAARQAREQAWQESLLSFEHTLFELSCSYAAALRNLPDGEHLTLVLKGLGESKGAGYQDRIHVLGKRDIERCQQGEITPLQLQALARSYSF